MSGANGNGNLPTHQKVRALALEEALTRVGELEEKNAALRKMSDHQGKAMEALANAITGYALDMAKLRQRLDALERPRWRRLVLWLGLTLRAISDWCEGWLWRQREPHTHGSVTMRRIPDGDECTCRLYEAGELTAPSTGVRPCQVHPQRTFYPGPCGVTN